MYKTYPEYVEELNTEIRDFTEALQNLCDSMYGDIHKELEDKKKKEQIKEEKMKSLYNKLDDNMSLRLYWIKKKLPWYITKFHQISSNEIRLINNTIYIGVNFSNSQLANCFVEINLSDLKGEK